MNEQIKNDSMVLINIVELASELAHERVIQDGPVNDEALINDDGTYTESAQNDFNQYYDEYYDLILSCK